MASRANMRCRHTPGRLGPALGLASILSLVLVGAPTRASDETRGSELEPARIRSFDVIVETRSEKGLVFCALWRNAEGYPERHDHAARDGMSASLDGRRARIHFEAVAYGDYALACFHDENANRTLDTNLIGIPSEGTGASNGARGWLGPPSYEAARFSVSAGGPDTLTVRIDY
jgi:uncharacterized protein (DUF2141 family)